MNARPAAGTFPVPTKARPRGVDPLESRRLYSATPILPPTTLKLSGDAGADAFYLRLVSPSTLGVWVNATRPGQGTPTRTVAARQVTAVAASGTGPDAALTLDLSGGLSFPGGVAWAGGPVVLTNVAADVTFGATTVTVGPTTIAYADADEVVVDAGPNPVAFAATATPAATVELDGYAADTLAIVGGRLTLAAASTAGPTLAVDDAAGLTIAGTAAAPVGAFALASLSIGDGATAAVDSSTAPARAVFSVGSLSIAASAGLNLNAADLIVHRGDPSQLTAWVRAGLDSGGTTGITAAVAAVRNELAPVANAGTAAGPLVRSFDGQTTTATDVLVAHAVVGDLNLDGTVDGADYVRLDAGFAAHLTGWANGDLNLDGRIDGSDYTLADNAYVRGGYSTESGTAPTPGAIRSPADLPGLVAWYKASPATVATDADGAVTRWADLSGHGHDLLPVAGDARPVLSADGSAVDFPYYNNPTNTDPAATGPVLATAGSVTVDPSDVSLFAAVQQRDVGNDYRTPTGDAVVVSRGLALDFDAYTGRWQFGDDATYAKGVPGNSGTSRVVVGATSGGGGVTTYQNGAASVRSPAVMTGASVTAPLTVGSPLAYPNAAESEVCLYDRPLTATEAAELTAYLARANAVTLAPELDAVVDGDSMSFDLNLPGAPVNTWVDRTPALATAAVHNYSRVGRQLADIDPATGQSEAFAEQNSFAGFDAADANLYVVFAGSNDVYNAGRTAAATFADLLALCDGAKAYGTAHGFAVRTLVVTAPRRGVAAGKTADDPALGAFDALIRADRSGAFDGVADVAALPQLQNPNDPAYFAPDGIHPNAAGEAVIANAVNATVAATYRQA